MSRPSAGGEQQQGGSEFDRLVSRLSAWTPDAPVPDVHTIRWLRDQELPGTPFLFEGRVPYGIWTHWTKAGGYKSALAAQLEHFIAYGHAVPGLSWTPNRRGSVLVIDPDGTAQESQDRTFKIAPDGLLETDGDGWSTPGRAEIVTIHEPKGATVEERIVWLWQQIGRWEKAIGPIPWIRWDTLGSLLGSSDKNAYDHAAGPLRALNHRMAAEGRVLFLPHHAGKSGEMIGSTAIYGSSNLVTKVVRTKGANTGTVEVDGKVRGTAPWSLSVAFEAGTVRLVDYHPVQARHKPGSVARRVADHLADAGACVQPELYEAMPGVPANQVRKAVSRMEADGQVVRDAERISLHDPIPTEYRVPESWPAGTIGAELSPVDLPPAGPAAAAREQLRAALIPAQRSDEPEPVPDLPISNPAIEKMIELLPSGKGMYPERRLKPEIKAQLGYERVCLGGRPNGYMMFPAVEPSGRVVVLDRRAAFFQSAAKVWLVPNQLSRIPVDDYSADVYRASRAGMFQIVAPVWESERPNPLGQRIKAGARVLVPRPTLDRLMDCVRLGMCQEPAILHGLVGKGTEALLRPWAQWCMDQRRGLVGERLDEMKAWQSQAVSCLRKTDPDAPVGPFDRPDWQYAIHGHHYATMSRCVYKSLDMGDEVLAYGNTDEIVFRVPDGADPGSWVPGSMLEHLGRNRFSVKYRLSAEEWFANPMQRGLNRG